ncbi:MAG TPA: hypothetical protein VH500_04235 [Nitrososphaeraceae archaeon]
MIRLEKLKDVSKIHFGNTDIPLAFFTTFRYYNIFNEIRKSIIIECCGMDKHRKSEKYAAGVIPR